MGNKLTLRETGILELIKLGSSNREVASKLGLSIGTIKGHLQTIFKKLRAVSRTDAVVKAHRVGYIKLNKEG